MDKGVKGGTVLKSDINIEINMLLREIDHKREVMISTAMATGFTSVETIKCSQELDSLINQYQFCKVIEKKMGFYQTMLNALALFVINPMWTINRVR
jgi:hypothetical protein